MPRVLSIFLILVILVAIIFAATAVAAHRGACGDGDFHRPPCAGFAFGLGLYGMIAVLAVTILATIVTFAFGRRPPVLLMAASMLSVAAVAVLALAIRTGGNKLAGAVALMMILPLILSLLGGGALCVLIWIGNVAGDWIERRDASCTHE